ncbi:MAG: hypothetical protein CMC21_04265 [Flavobacteriaceae bacterium]|nr:hypothetical protein [Flavobacteriaceae bacterium]|tara:strand:+ start:70 stop:318 length:249 start_codon:yes stop_codon:yes gene_type:complete
MSIRIGNSCSNCENLQQNSICKIHMVTVNPAYTCNSFNMKTAIKNDPSCISCIRYEAPSCANPKKAAPKMSCSNWAPQNAIA